eukprot:3374484-Prymnesium_polylepis.1
MAAARAEARLAVRAEARATALVGSVAGMAAGMAAARAAARTAAMSIHTKDTPAAESAAAVYNRERLQAHVALLVKHAGRCPSALLAAKKPPELLAAVLLALRIERESRGQTLDWIHGRGTPTQNNRLRDVVHAAVEAFATAPLRDQLAPLRDHFTHAIQKWCWDNNPESTKHGCYIVDLHHHNVGDALRAAALHLERALLRPTGPQVGRRNGRKESGQLRFNCGKGLHSTRGPRVLAAVVALISYTFDIPPRAVHLASDAHVSVPQPWLKGRGRECRMRELQGSHLTSISSDALHRLQTCLQDNFANLDYASVEQAVCASLTEITAIVLPKAMVAHLIFQLSALGQCLGTGMLLAKDRCHTSGRDLPVELPTEFTGFHDVVSKSCTFLRQSCMWLGHTLDSPAMAADAEATEPCPPHLCESLNQLCTALKTITGPCSCQAPAAQMGLVLRSADGTFLCRPCWEATETNSVPHWWIRLRCEHPVEFGAIHTASEKPQAKPVSLRVAAELLGGRLPEKRKKSGPMVYQQRLKRLTCTSSPPRPPSASPPPPSS